MTVDAFFCYYSGQMTLGNNRMGDVYFFDMPVYRVSYDDYNATMDQAINAQLTNLARYAPPGYEVPEATKMGISDHQYRTFGPWRFNEILGYIRLHFLGTQVRGEYFSAEKKRNPIGRKKVFTYRTHKLAPEVNLPRQPTNQQIFGAVREYVSRCRGELPKGRVVDDSLLDAVGPHVDWRGLLGWATIADLHGTSSDQVAPVPL